MKLYAVPLELESQSYEIFQQYIYGRVPEERHIKQLTFLMSQLIHGSCRQAGLAVTENTSQNFKF